MIKIIFRYLNWWKNKHIQNIGCSSNKKKLWVNFYIFNWKINFIVEIEVNLLKLFQNKYENIIKTSIKKLDINS